MLDQSQDIQSLILAELKALKEKLAEPKLHERDLWDTNAIAEYLDISRYTVQTGIVKQPGFPLPAEIPASNGGDTRIRRWYAGEVRQWVARFRPEANQVLRRVR